jgi:hypothetical protein
MPITAYFRIFIFLCAIVSCSNPTNESNTIPIWRANIRYNNLSSNFQKVGLTKNDKTRHLKIKHKDNNLKVKCKKSDLLYKKKISQLKKLSTDKDKVLSEQFSILQKKLKEEGLIGLKTKFVNIKFEDKLISYLFLEGKDKRLIESNKRREGKIYDLKTVNNLNLKVSKTCWLDFKLSLEKYNWNEKSQIVFYHNPITYLCEPILLDYNNEKSQFVDKIEIDNVLSNSHYSMLQIEKYFNLQGDSLILKSSIKNISEGVIIPRGYKVFMANHKSLNLTDSSYIWSYSPIQIGSFDSGTILFSSSDQSSKGIHVICTNDTSYLINATFENLNPFNNKTHSLPSCITFYESPVKLENVCLKDFQGEDMLNIFRSDFSIKNSSFHNSFSDQLDLDFSNGLCTNNKFNNSGNDAIDASGSIIKILNCTFNQTEDKAISAGEKSVLTLKNCTINKSSLAFTSKDKSKIEVNNCFVDSVEVVFCAFQKKAEYGPSSIIAKSIQLGFYKEHHLIEAESKLSIDGKTIQGKTDQVKKYLYGNEYGKKTVK